MQPDVVFIWAEQAHEWRFAVHGEPSSDLERQALYVIVDT
jgi:hypothetical protein